MTPDDTDKGEQGRRRDDTAPPAHDEEHGGTAMHDDDAFDRLRAADPATDTPDPAAAVLRAKVDARIGHDAPEAVGAGTVGGSAADRAAHEAGGTDELARRRSRRQPWLIAAAVAGFVVVGGGGYAAGAGGLSIDTIATDVAADSAAPPMTLEAEDSGASGAAPGERVIGEDGAEPGTLVVPPVPGVGTMIYPPTSPTGSRTVFHPGAGLSDDGGEALAYTLDTTTGFTRETAQDAADALGIRAEVREEDGAWVAGTSGSKAGFLRITADGRTSFWYSGQEPLSWGCTEPMPVEPKSDRAPDGDDQATAICPQGDKEAGSPSVSVATDEVRRVMAALGMDTGAFTFEGHPSAGGTSVVANHVIDGRQTGLSWSGTVTGTGDDVGIAVLSGFLAPVTELGTYPIVSEREAAERLGDPRFGSLHGPIRTLAATPRGGSAGGDTASSGSAPADGTTSDGAGADAKGSGSVTSDSVAPDSLQPAERPTPPGAGDEIGWPVRDVTVTEASLGVAQHTLPSGAVVLIPAYELTGDGGTWSVIAVTDSMLDFAAK